MIYQRLDTKGTLSGEAVAGMLVGSVRQYVPRAEDAEPLSANTSAYSQARSKLPVDMAEKASDVIFDGLRQDAHDPLGVGAATDVFAGRVFDLTAAHPRS